MAMSKEANLKYYWLKIRLTYDQKILVWKIFGPHRHVSTRIRELILDPFARKNPDQWAAFIGVTNAIEAKLEQNLKALKSDSPSACCDFVSACYAAIQLLEELRRHEP